MLMLPDWFAVVVNDIYLNIYSMPVLYHILIVYWSVCMMSLLTFEPVQKGNQILVSFVKHMILNLVICIRPHSWSYSQLTSLN